MSKTKLVTYRYDRTVNYNYNNARIAVEITEELEPGDDEETVYQRLRKNVRNMVDFDAERAKHALRNEAQSINK